MNDIVIRNEIINNMSGYIIAEIGLNHNNDIELTKKMIKKAKESGANAVKFQYFITENLMLPQSPAFHIFKNLELSKERLKTIIQYCKEIDITFFATPFCKKTADDLEELNVPCYKIASSDLNYYDFISYIAMKRKPVILSTGMGSIGEIEKAVNSIYKVGNSQIVILHCISKYPATASEFDINMITKLQKLFPEFIIGVSDHSMDNTVSIAAKVLGAKVFERHFTIDRTLPGPDQSISLEPKELKDLREKIDQLDSGLKNSYEERSDIEIKQFARRSLVANCDIKAGTIMRSDMIKIVRPGTGISPEFISLLVGRKVIKDIKEDEILRIDHFN